MLASSLLCDVSVWHMSSASSTPQTHALIISINSVHLWDVFAVLDDIFVAVTAICAMPETSQPGSSHKF